MAKRYPFGKGMGESRRVRGGVWLGDSSYVQVFSLGVRRSLGNGFRAFGGYGTQSGDQPARKLGWGREGEK